MENRGEIAKQLAALRERAGLSAQDVVDELSAARGKKVPKSTYTHYESKKFKQKAIPFALAQELAAIFEPRGVPEVEVLLLAGIAPGLISRGRKPVDSEFRSEHKRTAESVRVLTEHEDLPVYGYVAGKGEDEVFFIDQGHEMTRTVRPNVLKNVDNGYAVDVFGESMAPRFEPGNRLWVHPKRPYRTGDDVVVQLDEDRAMVKRVVRKTEKHLILEQFNPPKQLRVEWAEIKQVDLVVGMVTIAT